MGDATCRCSTYALADPFADGYLIVTGHHPHCPDGGCVRTRLTSRDVIEKLVAEVGRLREALESAGRARDGARAERDALMGLIVRPWTRDDGERLWEINLAWFDTAESEEEAVAWVRAAAGLGPAEGGGE